MGYNPRMPADLSPYPKDAKRNPENQLTLAGQAANLAAARARFLDYRQRRAKNTIRRQDADLAAFSAYLYEIGVQAGELGSDPDAWRGVSWGLVEGFVKWQVAKGYAIGSINVRLSTVKTYCQLAMQAGALDPQEVALIRTVSGYRSKEAGRIDAARETARVGEKKAEPVLISLEQARALKRQPDTPQGRRDALLLCLLLDHGLRVSEIARLTVANVQLQDKLFQFYRPKVDKVQIHRMSRDTYQAVQAYFSYGDVQAVGPLLRSSLKSGALDKSGLGRGPSGRG